MMKRVLALSLLALVVLCAAFARTRTTQPNLRTAAILIEPIPLTHAADSAAVAAVDQYAITLRGFNKRLRDSKETFLVTNNTDRRISALRITLRYSTLDGSMIHERTVTIPVMINPHQTQLAEVKTFDTQHQFYYYAGPTPKKSATPFQVAYRLVGYDVPVGY
ncbi:MAG: hypothetical protein IJT30_06630 [Muribaculaceae bacterium]|nr:hypothetical protein [Muribaculaceae bacterium]